MSRKLLCIVLTVLVVALATSPLLPNSILADEPDARQKMHQALKDTIEEFGWDIKYLDLYVSDDSEAKFGTVWSSSFYPKRGGILRTGDEGAYVRIEDFKSNGQWRIPSEALDEPGATHEIISFHGYPGAVWTYYNNEGDLWRKMAWAIDQWYFGIGSPTWDFDYLKSIAEVLYKNVQRQGLLGNIPPLASFGIYPPNPTPNDLVVFVSTSSDADGDVLSYRWYIDGEYKGSFPSYEAGKLKPGNYAVTLLVDDGKGGKDEVSLMITIGLPASLELSASPEEVTLKNEEETSFTLTVTIKDDAGRPVDGAYVYLICEDPDFLTTRWWGKWVEKKYTENGAVEFSGTFPDLLDVSTMVEFPTYVYFTVKAGKVGETWELTGEKTINVLAEPRLFEIVLFDYYPEPKMKRAVFSDSDYYLRVKIRDEGDSIYWDYFITTPIGNLSGVDTTVSADGKKILVNSPFDEEQVAWHTPERGINLEDLEFAKKLYQINLAYARNLGATAAGTIPVYGRFIKGANDAYNVYDGVKTTWGYSEKAWRNLQRFEIIGAIMDAGNAGIEAIQTTAGAVLIVPKADSPSRGKRSR